MRNIAEWLDWSASRVPERPAVEDPEGRSICYRDLANLSRMLSEELYGAYGVNRGDRVGVLMRKSLDTVIAFYSVLRCGAAYVPIDPYSPMIRAALMVYECEAKVVLVDEDLAEGLRSRLSALSEKPHILPVPQSHGREYASGIALLLRDGSAKIDGRQNSGLGRIDDVAFMLFTSGSTGKPKAVMLTHENVVDFVDWCSEAFGPSEDDRFATHSPLHFSLPVFNLYVACKHGGTVCLIDDRAARVPQLLAPLLERLNITVWFSTPAIFSLLAQFGQLQSLKLEHLRLVMFGGEPLRVGVLRALKSQLGRPRYVHVLGATEAHIMAHYEVPDEFPAGNTAVVPVGNVSRRFRSRVVDDDRNEVSLGADGELCLAGPGVALGYWKAAEATKRAFFTDSDGQRWYRTGDIVYVRPDGLLIHRGRRDRLVKRRGNRIELGEIEACLATNMDVVEVAVIAVQDKQLGLIIQAFVVAHNRPSQPSVIALKAHCAEYLPSYMVPDTFECLDALPRTSTGKVNYLELRLIASATRQGSQSC